MMLLIPFFILITIALAAFPSGDASVLTPAVVPMEWQVQAFVDGPTLTLNGTVQDVERQLIAINPNYKTADFHNRTAAGRDVERRLDFSGADIICSKKLFGSVKSKGFNDAYARFNNMQGRPNLPPGPKVCSRISCSWDTALWLCNDMPGRMLLDTWNTVFKALNEIWRRCSNNSNKGVGGQIFHRTNWNMIMTSDRC
ncbi:hypothetical protein RJ55_01178 [Drechmeria coniospora]|nr:hypothetical protein RJ55_01178 [Drechmeria coniospora]